MRGETKGATIKPTPVTLGAGEEEGAKVMNHYCPNL